MISPTNDKKKQEREREAVVMVMALLEGYEGRRKKRGGGER
jgi:hypothetical protein